ncbi:MAG: DUF4058 family protein [Anaerolineae bacterium]
MPSPFPGMDPYLEHRELWPGFHADLAVEIKRRLNRNLSERYYADVEILTVSDDADLEILHKTRPDVSVFETVSADEPTLDIGAGPVLAPAPVMRLAPLPTRLRSVRVYHAATQELVTTIEILSPFNKRVGSDGLSDYRRKRRLILASQVHLVEVDLLRGGERPGLEIADDPIDTDYVLLVNRYGLERISEIWPVALNEPLPLIPVPLLPPDPDVALDLNAAIREVYDGSRYERRIAYTLPAPQPPLRPAMMAWVATLLASRSTPPA